MAVPSNLQWQDVDSSMISQVGWLTGVLFIRFKNNGRVYSASTPKAELDGLISADSAGKHFNAELKGTYDFVEQSE